MNIPTHRPLDELRQELAEKIISRLDTLRDLYPAVSEADWLLAESKLLQQLIDYLTTLDGQLAAPLDALPKDCFEANPAKDSEWQAIGSILGRLEQLTRSGLTLHVDAQGGYNPTPRIALFIKDPLEAEQIQQWLQSQAYQVDCPMDFAAYGQHLIENEQSKPHLLIVDMAYIDDQTITAQTLVQMALTAELGVSLLVVSTQDDLSARLLALRTGAQRYLCRPLQEGALIEAADQLTGRYIPKPYQILLVDDDQISLTMQASVLQKAGMQVRTLNNPLQILQVLDEFEPDVLLLDVYMPEVTGLELVSVLRERDADLYLPVLFLSGETDISRQLMALKFGGDDFLVKPVQSDQLIGAVTAFARRSRQNRAMRQRLQRTHYEREREYMALDQHAIVSIADSNGNITYANEKFCQISGYSHAELIGKNHRIVKSDQHSHAFYQDLWHTILAGQIWQGEICNQRKDGSLYWVKSTITPFLDEDGRPYQYVSIRTDITDIKQSEQQLRLLGSAIEASTSGITIADASLPDVPLIYVNKGFELITGYSRQEALGQNCRFLNSQEREQPGLQTLRQALAEGRRIEVLLRNRRKNGELFWNELHITPVYEHSGRLTHFISVSKDVTERIKADEALKSSEDQLRATLESTKDGILAIDHEGLVRFANQQFARMWGIDSQLIQPGEPARALLTFLQDQIIQPEPFLQKAMELFYADEELLGILALSNDRLFEYYSRLMGGDHLAISGRVWSFRDITEAKRAERLAEYHKERLRRGQIYANIGTWEWDLISNDLFWTERIAPLFGYASGELETSFDNFINAVHPDDREQVLNAVQACIQEDVPYQIEHRVVWPNGTVRWLLERGAVVRDNEGKARQMIGVVQDIDDRKRAELALAKREQQLREAQSLARIGNWTADWRSGQLTWSDEVYRIFGQDPDRFTPSVSAFYATVHPDDLDKLAQAHQQAIVNGFLDVVHRILRPNGHVRHVHELAKTTYDAQGQLLALTGTVQDITERLNAEHRLEIFKHIVSSVVDGVITIDSAGLIQSVNPSACEMFGYTESALLGQNVNILMPEPYRSAHDGYIRQFMTSKTGRIIGRQLELVGIRSDGEEFPLEIAVTEITFENSILFVGLTRDITQRKLEEQQLIQARDEAERANKAKSDFLSSMSHELRTPMNAILGFGQLLEYDDTLTPTQHEDVQAILKAGNHLLNLINEVLDLAKVESGNLQLSLEPVEILPVIDECLSLIRTQAEQRQIKICTSQVGRLSVIADRTRLKQILLNLLSNAIKYNHQAGQVMVDTEVTPLQQIKIRVTDTGPGIDPQRLQELFQPFNRLDAEKSGIEGTGIGLTITRRIIEMMNGKVDVHSQLGIGSVFWIELPQAETLDDAGQTGMVHDEVAESADEAIDYLLLYIEDNPTNIRLIEQILARRQNVRLQTAHTPSLGIELALSLRPDLILLDINLPGMDGYQVMKIFQADDRLKQIPVVALTANAMPKDVERGMAAGFVDYLTKPLNLAHFNAVLDEVLNTIDQKRHG